MRQTRKTKPGKQSEWLSLPKAAALLGCHRQTVANMAARGEIGSLVVADRLVVSRKDCEEIAAERQSTAA